MGTFNTITMSTSAMEMSSAEATELVSQSPDQLKANGYSQLSLGKRHLLVSDIPEAVSTLALACDLLAKQFGETHVECAEAYFYYGRLFSRCPGLRVRSWGMP